MDPFDTSLFEPPPDTMEDEKKTDPFDDIFGDADVAAASKNDSLFNSDEEGAGKADLFAVGAVSSKFAPAKDLDDLFGPPPVPADNAPGNDLDDLFGPPPVPADNSSSSRGADFMMSSSSAGDASLFDDLLEFSSGTASMSSVAPAAATRDVVSDAQNETSASKVTPSSDWLFGGDDVVDASTECKSGVVTERVSEVPIMEDQQETASKDNDVFKPEETEDESTRSPNVMVTAPSMDLDFPDAGKFQGNTNANGSEGEKGKNFEGDGSKSTVRGMEASVGGDASDKVDSRASSTSDVDLDFSILELPGTAHLNFDMSNHKRTLSKKGSISRRKRPTRAAIQTSKLASSEDSIFVDSTEPRPPRAVQVDEEEESQEQTTKKREADKSPEQSPSRSPKKVAPGGVKIPGLLEGLMGSKRFNKNENKQSPDKSSSPKPAPSPFAKPATNESWASDARKTSPPAPAPRPKPAALPRVLPALPGNPLKSVNNQSASSVKNPEEDKASTPSFLPQKPVLKSLESPEKTSSSSLTATVKKDIDSPSTSSPSSQVKDTKPSLSSLAAKDTKVSQSPVSSRALPSLGSADSRKPLAGQGLAKPEVRKKPPSVMKKPTLKSKPDKLTTSGEKAEVKVTEKSLKEQSGEKKGEGNSLPLSKPSTISKSTAAEEAPDMTEKWLETKNSKKEMNEKGVEKTDVIIDKPDSESEHKKDLNDPKAIVSSSGMVPSKETKINNVNSKTSTKVLSEEIDSSNIDKSDSLSNLKDSLKSSIQTSSSSTTTLTSSIKSNMSNPKESEPDTPASSTSAAASSTPAPRKLSVSSVKPPSSSDKASSSPRSPASTSGNMGRRDSITGSAYNPIGFRSTLGSSDSGSESRSRGSSIGSERKFRGDSVSSTGSDSTKKVSDLTSSGVSSKASSESPAKDTVEVIMRKKPEKPESKPSWLLETNKNSLNRAKRPEVPDKTKEAANEANKIIKDQGSLRKVSAMAKTSTTGSPNSETGSEDNKSSSPFGVRLRKVDSSRPKSVVEPTNNENSSPGVNWRQQMSQRRQSYVPPKEVEKPKQQDSTPEWAKASIQRRQRLLDSGVIKTDAK